jgi:hypothetical protein
VRIGEGGADEKTKMDAAKSIGGNEMLLQEMIEQSKIKKGYISKTELMRINLMNLTLVAGGNPEDLLPAHKKIASKTTDKKG